MTQIGPKSFDITSIVMGKGPDLVWGKDYHFLSDKGKNENVYFSENLTRKVKVGKNGTLNCSLKGLKSRDFALKWSKTIL